MGPVIVDCRMLTKRVAPTLGSKSVVISSTTSRDGRVSVNSWPMGPKNWMLTNRSGGKGIIHLVAREWKCPDGGRGCPERAISIAAANSVRVHFTSRYLFILSPCSSGLLSGVPALPAGGPVIVTTSPESATVTFGTASNSSVAITSVALTEPGSSQISDLVTATSDVGFAELSLYAQEVDGGLTNFEIDNVALKPIPNPPRSSSGSPRPRRSD